MTNSYTDMKNSSCFLVFSNPAEAHPCSMQFVNEARFGTNQAKLIVVEPRRTRLASQADLYLRIRPGTDIAFINGVLKRHFANIDAGDTSQTTAALPAGPGAYLRATQAIGTHTGGSWFHDAATMAGMQWPRWSDALFRTNEGHGTVPAGKPTDYLRYGRDIDATVSSPERDADPNWAGGAGWLAANDAFANKEQLPVLANNLNASASGGSMTVYEAYKARVAAYDTAKVADICGCDADIFEQVADSYLGLSWANNHSTTNALNYKAGTILYAMGTTQHSYGSANVKSYANLQVCTGNIGKQGGGVNALRGVGNVQGSTDQNLLWHLYMAYIGVPTKTGKINGITGPAVDGTYVVNVTGKPALWHHNISEDTGAGNNYANAPGLTDGYDSTQPEVCCRVLIGDKTGFIAATANTYSYIGNSNIGSIANCGTPVLKVSAGVAAGTYDVKVADNPGTAPAGTECLFTDYETWLASKSFGGRKIYPVKTVHAKADTTNRVGAANATDLATAMSLANEIKADYNAHLSETGVHAANDGVNNVTSPDATDQASLNTLANEIKADYNAHRSQAGVHVNNDTGNEVTSADASDLATAITLVNEIKADYNAHGLSCSTNQPYPSGWTFTSGIPWGHQGTWAAVRTMFSEGYGGSAAAGGTIGDTAAQAAGATNYMFNNYMAKGNGFDWRTLMQQTNASMPGFDSNLATVTGVVNIGMNTRVTAANALQQGAGFKNLDWLVCADPFLTESADAPRKNGGITYFLPVCHTSDTCGTISNSGRIIQWLYQAAKPPVDTRTDLEILCKLARAAMSKANINLGYADGITAYEKTWRDQYAGDPSGPDAGILQGVGAWVNGKCLADPATAWDNDDYRATTQGEDNGIENAGLGEPGYQERVYIQMGTNSNDRYGNAGTNWLHGSKAGGGGKYGCWHDPAVAAGDMTDKPSNSGVLSSSPDDVKYNRSQARNYSDSTGNNGIYPGFAWAWLRNRRIFYNKGFAEGDIADIFVSPDEVGTLFVGVPGYTNRHSVVSYSGCWRASRNLTDIPLASADKVWSKLGYTPVHWEPHESPRGDLVTAYGQIGMESVQPYADDNADRAEFPLVLTTYRHIEHYQGGGETRRVPWLIELVPEAVVEINSVDAAANGIAPGDLVEIQTMRTKNTSTPWIGPWRAVVGSGVANTQKVGPGVVAAPWHWGSKGLATGPTANELCIDAVDANTRMPETKACLCKIRKKP